MQKSFDSRGNMLSVKCQLTFATPYIDHIHFYLTCFYVVNIYRSAETIMVTCMLVIFTKKKSLGIKQCIFVCVNISVSAVIDCQKPVKVNKIVASALGKKVCSPQECTSQCLNQTDL